MLLQSARVVRWRRGQTVCADVSMSAWACPRDKDERVHADQMLCWDTHSSTVTSHSTLVGNHSPFGAVVGAAVVGCAVVGAAVVGCVVVGVDVVGSAVVGAAVVGVAVVGCAVVGVAVVGVAVVGCAVAGGAVVGAAVVGCAVVGSAVVGVAVVGCAVVGGAGVRRRLLPGPASTKARSAATMTTPATSRMMKQRWWGAPFLSGCRQGSCDHKQAMDFPKCTTFPFGAKECLCGWRVCSPGQTCEGGLFRGVACSWGVGVRGGCACEMLVLENESLVRGC
jgi:hypothetical protein